MKLKSISICIAALGVQLENEIDINKQNNFINKIREYLKDFSLQIPEEKVNKFNKDTEKYLVNQDLNKIMNTLNKFY